MGRKGGKVQGPSTEGSLAGLEDKDTVRRMRLALLLLLLTACGTSPPEPALVNAQAEARVQAPAAGVPSRSHEYQSEDTGAWSVFLRSGRVQNPLTFGSRAVFINSLIAHTMASARSGEPAPW